MILGLLELHLATVFASLSFHSVANLPPNLRRSVDLIVPLYLSTNPCD
jgi:hypothetical protein